MYAIENAPNLLEVEECPCPLCGGFDGDVKYRSTIDSIRQLDPSAFACTSLSHNSHFQIRRCRDCTMLYCSPRPTGESLTELYREVRDEDYLDHQEARVKTFRRALRRIGRTSGSLLDIGCGTGVFLCVARESGFRVTGIEPSLFASQYARNHYNLEVHTCALPCDGLPDERFDVITMWDVIEHLLSPLDALRSAYTLLSPGGELHLSTMDIGSLYARAMGERWPWYMPMHLHFFTRKTIRAMLAAAGFEEISISLYTHVVHRDYLLRKASVLRQPSKLLARLGTYFCDREGFLPVRLGDLMHVRATKPLI